MISLRKLAFSFLAPIGALTIIGTGFATWTFSNGEVPIEVSENFQDNVSVTAEVTNGNLEVLNVPKVLVFSEGDQGQDDLFDGISFYSDKVVKKGQDFAVKITNDEGANHKLSFVYDDTIAEPKIYFSWSDTIDVTLFINDDMTGSYNGMSFTYTVEGNEILGTTDDGTEITITYIPETQEIEVHVQDPEGYEFSGTLSDYTPAEGDSSETTPESFYGTWTGVLEGMNPIDGNYSSIISGELTSSNAGDSYFGSWEGLCYGNGLNDTYKVKLTLNEANEEGDLTGTIDINDNNSKVICNDTFTYETKDGIPNPTITVTDSTFAFRYIYDNPDLINEDDTHFKLNVELGLFLESREDFKFENVRLNGDTLVWEKPEGTQGSLKLFNSLTLQKNDGKDDYDLAIGLDQKEGSLSSRITFPNLILSKLEAGDTSLLPAGTYSGVSLSGIPCTLNLTKNNNATYNISLEIGAMTHYLSLSDTFKAVQDKEGFFNITSSNESKVYAEGTLHMDIDDSNLNKRHYIDFTCQLANYLRYASVNVKPNKLEKYFGLRVASILGGWEFKIIVNAYFTAI